MNSDICGNNNIETLLTRYMEKDLSEDEMLHVEKLLKDDPALYKRYLRVKEIHDILINPPEVPNITDEQIRINKEMLFKEIGIADNILPEEDVVGEDGLARVRRVAKDFVTYRWPKYIDRFDELWTFSEKSVQEPDTKYGDLVPVEGLAFSGDLPIEIQVIKNVLCLFITILNSSPIDSPESLSKLIKLHSNKLSISNKLAQEVNKYLKHILFKE